MIKTDRTRIISRGVSRSRRLAQLTFGALVLASACSLDSNGLNEPPSGKGGGVVHQTGSGGIKGTGGGSGGQVAGTSSGGSGPSSSGGAGGTGGGLTGTGGAATASGGTIGGASGGRGGTGAGGTGGAINPGPGSGGSAAAGSGGTIAGSASGGATPTGGVNASGGVKGAGGRGGSGNAGGSTTGPGGHGGASPFICGPLTCANGCCEGNSCITKRTDERCGKAGASCASCGKCFQCADAGSCEVDPSSTWRIVCSSAVLSATKANGDDWDPTPAAGPGPGPGSGPGPVGPGMQAASLPDPICQLSLGADGFDDVSTSVIMNTTTPKWDESITPSMTPLTAARLMSQATPWSISVSDDDERVSSDLVCRMTPQLTSADFAAAEATFPSTQGCTSLHIHLMCVGG